MQKVEGGGGPAQLVLGLASGTVKLAGEAVELPPREFKLLSKLAVHVGEPIESSALIAAAWPDAPWTTPQDLYVLVSKLRRQIDGSTGFGQNIRNRRGFGYILDLPSGEVVVEETRSSEAVVVDLRDEESQDEPPNIEEPADVSDFVSPPLDDTKVPEPTPTRPRRSKKVAKAIVLVTASLGLSWGAGYALSSRLADPTNPKVASEPSPSRRERPSRDHVGEEPEQEKEQIKGREKPPRGPTKRPSADRSTTIVVATGRSTNSAENPTLAPSNDPQTPSHPGGSKEPKESNDSGKSPAGSRSKPAPLPPAPTRYLYHLTSKETGDHFVTTDSSAASEYEARGYQGGAIARIYTYQEAETKAITTNQGTAYVFIDSAPKTDPQSQPLALWYSTNNAGDFFYSTSESEAKRNGWTGSLIGYVRAL